MHVYVCVIKYVGYVCLFVPASVCALWQIRDVVGKGNGICVQT